MPEWEFLIVGLGNPGARYEKTRHNFGFMVAEAFAEKQGISFKRSWHFKGRIAIGVVESKKVYVLMPTTYMNLSGQAVHACMNYYRIPLQNILVVVDEVHLDLGRVRCRPEGSSGGHNGLKSIENCLHTQEYSRLRMGIRGKSLSESNLEAYVLGNFDTEEQKILPDIVQSGVIVSKCWLTQGIEPAMQLAGTI